MNEEKPGAENGELGDENSERASTNFHDKRERFFAKREGAFLWLLAPPVLIIGVLVMVIILFWLSRQVGILSTLATP